MTATIIALAVSGSMAFPVTLDSRRIDVLRANPATILPAVPDTRLIAFNDDVFPLEPGQAVPEPAGGTALHLALERVAATRCEHVVVVTDGEPNDKHAAVAAGRKLDCRISTYFCGEETNRADFQLPTAEILQTPPPPLLSTKDDFTTASLRLKDRKALRGQGGGQ
jgi:hypothetical protein